MGKFLIGVMVLLAVLAIGYGFYITGGPYAARNNRFDEQRLMDLAQISKALQCGYYAIEDRDLPQTLSIDSLSEYCPSVTLTDDELVDNETGNPYEYTRESDIRYIVCADFYDSAGSIERNRYIYFGRTDRAAFYRNEGCVKGNIR